MERVAECVYEQGAGARLRDQLKYDALYPDPSKTHGACEQSRYARFMSLEGATTEGAMMHVAFVLSVRGIPQLYYGEEIAMEGEGRSRQPARFSGGFPLSRLRTGESRKSRRCLNGRAWIRLRREHAAIERGR